jgi:hypothetical protein
MRIIFGVLLSLIAGLAVGREVFRCDEPTGVTLRSTKAHKPVSDGFKGVRPVVIIDGDDMTVVWGDSESPEARERAWKAVVFHRNPESLSAVTAIEGPGGSTKMLFTVDLKRRFLYYSSHRENPVLGSDSNAYVSKCK